MRSCAAVAASTSSTRGRRAATGASGAGPLLRRHGDRRAAAGDPAAPVLLFAHGFSLDLSTWSEQWPELSARYRCVLMDHRSHGASGPAADGDLTLRAMGRDLAAVLEAVSPDVPAIVVGHSMGAMAILALAEMRPELFGPRMRAWS
ncbi:MAG: alpha/beta fold hydrolase [Actinomycetota bacterium]